MKKYITPNIDIMDVLLQDVLSASYDETTYNLKLDNTGEDIFS